MDPDQEQVMNMSLRFTDFLTSLFYSQFRLILVDILPVGSNSVDPHIFADPDPGSQNLTDPNGSYALLHVKIK